ncbi:MAG: GntR family transcriptional regulator [Elusimicrobia bacterium]|nr:GntR family transcriptional regulator [Elusimicrobiota bacterium]
MPRLGKYNRLKIIKTVDFGLYLDGGEEFGEVLLPTRYIPEGVSEGDLLRVFLYRDSEDRVIATTEKPYAEVDGFAYLKVSAVNNLGAFLDWGLMKELLLPFSEQKGRVKVGDWCSVYIYLDEKSGRLVASERLGRFLSEEPPSYRINQEVRLFIYDETPEAFRAIINNSHTGLLYKNEVFVPLEKGRRIRGYIKKLREDSKIDLSLQKSGYKGNVLPAASAILEKLKESEGYIPLTDKSPPKEIYRIFGFSKKNFKKAVGNLYRKRLIRLEEDGIYLIDE